MKKYDEGSALRAIKQNPVITVNGNVITIVKDNNLVGNGTWGKIDFLVNYCGYIKEFVDMDEQRAIKIAERQAKKAAKKAARAERRKTKLNLVDSVELFVSKDEFYL